MRRSTTVRTIANTSCGPGYRAIKYMFKSHARLRTRSKWRFKNREQSACMFIAPECEQSHSLHDAICGSRN